MHLHLSLRSVFHKPIYTIIGERAQPISQALVVEIIGNKTRSLHLEYFFLTCTFAVKTCKRKQKLFTRLHKSLKQLCLCRRLAHNTHWLHALLQKSKCQLAVANKSLAFTFLQQTVCNKHLSAQQFYINAAVCTQALKPEA